jgi:transcriptional regulator with XRE-family HTH domain
VSQETTTLGARIAAGRKRLSLSQKQLAERLRREDGGSISPQYLNDIERDRRVPPDYLLQRIAAELGEDPDFLTILTRRIPDGLYSKLTTESGYQAFRKALPD